MRQSHNDRPSSSEKGVPGAYTKVLNAYTGVLSAHIAYPPPFFFAFIANTATQFTRDLTI